MAVPVGAADSAQQWLSHGSHFNLCTYMVIFTNVMLKQAAHEDVHVLGHLIVQACSQLHLLEFICII
jgi:hypothetical protein